MLKKLSRVALVGVSVVALKLAAQETATAATVPEAAAAKTASAKSTSAASNTKATATPATKKMVQDATINLQTTITGNQEQPKVLYILPWQSPEPTAVDFEPLDNQQKAVFNHVERDELRRELETADSIKD
jgi:pyruvate/2-oxoglutarate dehydrogenase complex dihydrolipoamide acyltransferase (E2) component